MESSQLAEEKETLEKLHQQFMNLQQDWNSFKQSNPITKRRHSSANDSDSMVRNLQLLDTSPRNLMSSLQSTISPLEGAWKVRTNDLAVQEIIRERREAIESGKLKGRRLFQGIHDENHEMGLLDFETEQHEEVRSMSFHGSDCGDLNESDANPFRLHGCSSSSSRSSNSSSLSLSGLNSERKKGEEVVQGCVKEEKGKNRVLLMRNWVAIVFFVFAICIIRILSGRFGCGYGGESQNKVILVPT